MKRTLLTLLGLLLLTASAAQAQFTYTTNADGITVTITGYTGSGGAVVIPDTTNGLPVTSIQIEAPFAYYNVTSVTIPDSVTNIGYSDFGTYCPSLTNITVAAQNPDYSSLNGVLFDKNQTTLIQYPLGLGGNYTVPDSVTSIGDVAFYGSDFEIYSPLTSVTIPNSVTNIGDEAFAGTALTSVMIPNSVIGIGDGAFANCYSLTNVTIPDGITNIGEDVFAGTALTSVTIPDSVIGIGKWAFANCYSLTNVAIPDSVTSIGNDAFLLTGLTSVYFQGNAPTLGTNDVFYGDNATVYYLPGTTGWDDFSANTGLSTMLWNPLIKTGDGSFGIQNHQFGFNIAGTTNIPVAVEVCTNLANPVWSPLQTVTLTNGLVHFSEPLQANVPGRFYRLDFP